MKNTELYNIELICPQVTHQLGLPMARTDVVAESRFSTTASGEQCAMTTGTTGMLRWCARPWTVDQLRQPKEMPSSVRVQETSGWTTSTVWGMSRPSCTADIPPLEKITVAMVKMLEWCVQVSSQLLLCCLLLFFFFNLISYSII